ncbi:MAG: helix-turn-helix domain-containing protein [Eubacteriales bacterium]|nr:helix-turn-helix domain-containing protein [Eubacteriales bacterium]
MAGKRTYKILLSDEDKKILHATIHNKKTCKMTIRRCQILLELDENAPKHLTQMQIAKAFGVSKATVSNIVSAYVNGGIPAIIKINRNPRSNAKRKIDGRMEAELIRIACSPAPDGRVRWTLRLLEKQVRLELGEPLSHESIRLVLKKMNFGLT